MRGYGATNGQYTGLRFTPENRLFIDGEIEYSWNILRKENNTNIPLIALKYKLTENDVVIYYQIDSYGKEKILLPGYNYKLNITLLSDLQIYI